MLDEQEAHINKHGSIQDTIVCKDGFKLSLKRKLTRLLFDEIP